MTTSLSKRSETKLLGTLVERDKHADELLATRYDILNQRLVEAELHLRGLRPIHSVWVEYGHSSHPDGGPMEWEVLGITKLKERLQEKWRICHGEGREGSDFIVENLKPIIDCPVEMRVRAAGVVGKLHEAIVKSKEAYVPQVDAAIRELTDLCARI
ncbi:MAG: hypothetical protein JWP89_5651 [Schlesneria sp.]|nr:hypothetical protein [Schlesneria sp.]